MTFNIGKLPKRHGELTIDHRDSPGITEEDAARFLARSGTDVGGPLVGLTEMPTKRCHRCGSVVVLTAYRVRPRGYCRKHDAYTCDACMPAVASGDCVPIEAIADRILGSNKPTPTLLIGRN